MKQPWKDNPLRFALKLALALGLLALFARACDNFIHMGYRAKAAEGLWYLDQIREAELAYHEEHGVFLAAALQPDPETDRRMLPFHIAEGSGWQKLEWPETDFFRCQYEVKLTGQGFLATSRCDVNGDGDYATFEATQDQPAKRTSSNRSY